MQPIPFSRRSATSFGGTPVASISRRFRRTVIPPTFPSRSRRSQVSRLSFPADKATSRVSGGSSVFSTSFFQRSACSARGSRSHDRRVRRKTRSFPAHKSFRLAFCRRSYKIEHTSGACLSSTSFFANSPARRIPGRNRRSRTGSRTPACGSAGRSNRERHHPRNQNKGQKSSGQFIPTK